MTEYLVRIDGGYLLSFGCGAKSQGKAAMFATEQRMLRKAGTNVEELSRTVTYGPLEKV